MFPCSSQFSILYCLITLKNCRNPFKYTTSKNLIVTSVRIKQEHDTTSAENLSVVIFVDKTNSNIPLRVFLYFVSRQFAKDRGPEHE